MTRKETILITVLVNTGLLAVLFVMAMRTDDEPLPTINETPQALVLQEELAPPMEILAVNTTNDEVDNLLKEFVPEATPQEEPYVTPPAEPTPAATQPQDDEDVRVVEVTVKRGDALEKIARANHTSVSAIRKANNLKNDQLKIGQVLKVPAGIPKKEAVAVKADPTPTVSGDPIYYTVKPGDNPWKIAKTYSVTPEDILKLNNMSPDKAKNLKVGDKIRVK